MTACSDINNTTSVQQYLLLDKLCTAAFQSVEAITAPLSLALKLHEFCTVHELQ
jgi:hypothetical protein